MGMFCHMGPLPPADRPTLRKHPIGSTEAVFESGEVGIALNTFPRLVLEVPYDRTCPYRGTHFSVSTTLRPAHLTYTPDRLYRGNRKSAFLVTDMFFLLGPLRPTSRLCLVVFPGPRIEKRASCGNFSSFCRPYVDARTAVRRPFSNLLKWE